MLRHIQNRFTYWLSESLPLRFLGTSATEALKEAVVAGLVTGFMRLGIPEAMGRLPSIEKLSVNEKKNLNIQ